jgi:hypothetical protein
MAGIINIADPQHKPVIDNPILRELANKIRSYGMDRPDTVMGVGAPRIGGFSNPQGMLRREILRRIVGTPSDPAETFGKGMTGNLFLTAGRTLADRIEADYPATKPYIERPIHSLMRLFRPDPMEAVTNPVGFSGQRMFKKEK